MPEEPAAAHALGHDVADRASRPPDRRRHAVVGALAPFDDVLVVAGKDLVSAVSGEHDLHVFGRQLRHHVGGNRRRVAERFIEVPGEVLDHRHDVRLEHQVVVVGAVQRRDPSRVVQVR